jgi:hypothetical protein
MRFSENPAAMTPPPDPLDPILDRWETPADRMPSLAPAVWRRIQDAQSRPGLFSWLMDSLANPPVAVLFAACCVFLGLFLAEVRINREQRQRGALLARSYIQLIDPLLKSANEGGAP